MPRSSWLIIGLDTPECLAAAVIDQPRPVRPARSAAIASGVLVRCAVRDRQGGSIPVNPCTRIKRPKAGKRVVEPLAAAAVLALRDAITPRYRVAVALGAGLGLREGEAFGLVLPRVDFLRRRVHVREQAQRGQLAADLKTEASARTVPADDWVLNEINAHIRLYGTGLGE